MAAPTAPTLTSLTTEGLKKAGYASPSSAQLTRAQDEWMEEIKNDVWAIGKRLKPLMTEHVEIVVSNQSRYNFPTDFSSIYDAKLLYGDTERSIGAVTSTSVFEIFDDDGYAYEFPYTLGTVYDEDEVEAPEIVITGGTGAGQSSQIISYDEDTGEATVSPAFTTEPAANDDYFLVDRVHPLELRTVNHFNQIAIPHELGDPRYLYQAGNANVAGASSNPGYYYIYPTPPEDHYYAIKLFYFVDLLTLDLASIMMSTLYKKWRNLWIQGVKAKQLEDDDDNRAPTEMQRYYNMVRDITRLETYGRNIVAARTGVRA